MVPGGVAAASEGGKVLSSWHLRLGPQARIRVSHHPKGRRVAFDIPVIGATETFERAKSQSSLPPRGFPLSLVLNVCSLSISLSPSPEESQGFQTLSPLGAQVAVGAGDRGRG